MLQAQALPKDSFENYEAETFPAQGGWGSDDGPGLDLLRSCQLMFATSGAS
jgi:hypothetical protein